MNCNGRYHIGTNPTSGAIEVIYELFDANGVALNPRNVITDPAQITTIMATLENPCVKEIDWEQTDHLICVTDDGSGSTPSGNPETWKKVEWYEKNEDPEVLPILRKVSYLDSSLVEAFAETFDEDGVSLGTTGTLPLVFTVGVCSTNLIFTSAC